MRFSIENIKFNLVDFLVVFSFFFFSFSLPFHGFKGLFLFSRLFLVCLVFICFFRKALDFKTVSCFLSCENFLKYLFFWFIFLFISVFYSLNPLYSFRVFLNYYFLNLMFSLSLFIVFLRFSWEEKFFRILLFVNFSFLFMFFLFLIKEFFEGKDLYEGSLLVSDIYFQGPWRLAFIISFFFFASLYMNFKNISFRIGVYVILVFDVVVLFLLGRRGTLFSIFLALMLLFIFGFRDKRLKRVVFFLLLVITSLGVFIFLSPYRDFILLRTEKIIFYNGFNKENIMKTGSLGTRLRMWNVYGRAVMKSPLKGVGLGLKTQTAVYKKEAKLTGYKEAHNTFINLALQAGLPAAFLFYFLLFYLVVSSIRYYQVSKKIEFLVISAFFLSYSLQSLIEYSLNNFKFIHFWVFVSIFLKNRFELFREVR